MISQERRTFTKEFKEQTVQLHGAEKPESELIKEYEPTPSALDNWVRRYSASGSLEEKDNRTPEEEELIQLRNMNQKLVFQSKPR